MSLIERCILDAIEVLGDLPLIVFDDLNYRTGSDNATEASNDCCDGSSVDQLTKRVSKVNGVNEFRKYSIYVCDQFNLIILNGVPGIQEERGNFTYISTFSCSVIDCVIVSRNLLHLYPSLLSLIHI